MFISPAYAQAGPAGAGFDIMTLVPLILIFVVFYFLLIRPQQKKAKEHRELLTALRRGDSIITSGGIVGKITRVINENELQVEIAEGVRVKVARNMVASLYARGDGDEDGDDEKSSKQAKEQAKEK